MALTPSRARLAALIALAALGGGLAVARCSPTQAPGPEARRPEVSRAPESGSPGWVEHHPVREGGPEPGLRVAFFGDQGLEPTGRSVLELVHRRGAQLVIHVGDLDYHDDPDAWDAQVSAALGADFPYFAAVGNHDLAAWDGYQAKLRARLARVKGAECSGDLGVRSSCYYRGLFFVLSGVGTLGQGHEPYIADELARDRSTWRICVWHKNQHDMQVGAKEDEVGWGAYQACQRGGAMIVTGHEHSYSRSYTLTALGDRTRGYGRTGEPATVEVGAGRTVVLVVGLGGESRRAFTADHGGDTWWASLYARDRQVENGKLVGESPDIEDGALFVEYAAGGDAKRAHAWFETVSGKHVDEFDVVSVK